MLKHLSNICIALCFFSTLSYAGNDTIRVRLKWWHQFQFAGYYTAQIKGFYQNENLKVQLFEGNKKTSTIQEVLNGSVDFGISGTDLLSSFTSGKPIVAVGALFQHSPYVIISDEKKGIRSPTDLIGKKIMATDTQGWTELQALFLREGISLDSLQIINHTWKNNDIVNGYADAMSGYQSVEVHQL
ncbi:MAG: ABC transporter substrate-binding protein, partial [Chitinophagaceae bacterium]